MILQTERLVLREFDVADAGFLLEVMNQPNYRRFIGDCGLRTASAAALYIEQQLIPAYAKHGFGFWMMLHDGVKVGFAGLIKRPELPHPDIGYALHPSFVGHGYTQEAVYGILEMSQSKLNLSTLLAITDPYNHASIKNLKNGGFEFIDQQDVFGDGELLTLYRHTFPIAAKN